MKISFSLLVALTALSQCTLGMAKSNYCSQSEAKSVEETVQQVETWPQFAAFYSKHGKCDVDALRYAFTQQVVRLAANDQGLLGLASLLAKHPYLKPIILGHLRSEAVSLDDRDQIFKALHACQSAQENICREVKNALEPE